jgi:choline-glycine betaine transporter
MSEEEPVMDHTKNLKKDLREYVEKRAELFRLTILEETSLLVAQGIQRVTGILLLAGAVLFAWFAFAFLLSELLNSMSAGFALSSVPLFLLAFIFMKNMSKKMTEQIQAGLIERALRSIKKKTDNGQEKTTEDE